MTSSVQICNLALTNLGAETISSFTDNTVNAKLCNRLYTDIVEEVICEGAWTSATYQASLARTTTTPTFKFSYEYQLPTDPKALKVIEINEDIPGTYNYEIHADKLLTDLESVSITYIGMIKNSEQFDVGLRRSIVARMTSAMAYTITGSAQIAAAWDQKYLDILQESLATNGLQGTADTMYAQEFIDVRYE